MGALPTASGRRRSGCAANLSGKTLTPDFTAVCTSQWDIYPKRAAVASPEEGRRGQEFHGCLALRVADIYLVHKAFCTAGWYDTQTSTQNRIEPRQIMSPHVCVFV